MGEGLKDFWKKNERKISMFITKSWQFRSFGCRYCCVQACERPMKLTLCYHSGNVVACGEKKGRGKN